MPYVEGSLLVVMEATSTNGSKLAVLCVDEQGSSHNGTASQVKVLRQARELKIPIWLIEFNPALGTPKYAECIHHVTNTQIAQAAGEGARRLRKPYLNAFMGTTLQDELKEAGVETIVLMGQHTNSCVRSTAIGGTDEPRMKDVQTSGAVHRGFTVCTALDIVVHEVPNEAFAQNRKVWVFRYL